MYVAHISFSALYQIGGITANHFIEIQSTFATIQSLLRFKGCKLTCFIEILST